MPGSPVHRLNDYAGLLNSQDFAKIENRLTRFEQNTGHQSVIAIFKTLDEQSIEDVSEKLFKSWRLGDKKENDGVLLVVSLDQHKMRIEVGYGLEGKLTDAASAQIIRNVIAPQFRNGDIAQGIWNYQASIEAIVQGQTPAQNSVDSQNGVRIKPFFNLLIAIIFFVFFILQRSRTILSPFGRRRKSYWFGGGDGFGGGGGGFGGFGGGGGGRSGGGGASGGW